MPCELSTASDKCLAVLGPICKDLIYLYNETEPNERLGGPVFYGGRVLTKLGVDAVIFPILSAADKSDLEPMSAPNLLIEPVWHSQTAVCTLRYLDPSQDRRQVELNAATKAPKVIDVVSRHCQRIATLHLGTATPFDVDTEMIRELTALGLQLSLDLQGPLRGKSLKIKEIFSWLSHLAVLKLDRQEGMLLCGKIDLESIASRLHQAGADTVLVTDGSNGSWVCNSQTSKFIAARRVEKVKDTTGCGDLFVVSFLHFYRRHSLVEAATQSTELVANYLTNSF